MKTLILITILTAFNLHAAHIQDGANLFGPDAATLETKLENSRVFVETFPKLDADIKSYANERIEAAAGTNGFLIVITMQPRQWRISMLPLGRVKSSTVDDAGKELVSHLKAHDATGGIIAVKQILEPESHALMWLFILTAIACLTLFIGILTWPKPKQKAVRKGPENKPESLSASQQAKAQRKFDGLSESQRTTIINNYQSSDHYCGNNDALLWYVLMNQNQPHYREADSIPYTPPAAYEAPSRSYEPPSRSSDDSGSSGGWDSSSSSSDSGSSSYDSGSSSSSDSGSSDSSGGGGSW